MTHDRAPAPARERTFTARLPTRMLVVLLGGIGYWLLVSVATGVSEPWDADTYWPFLYPASLILSAAAGAWAKRHAWVAGALVIFGQLPVMMLNAGPGPLWAVGVLALLLLSIPAMAAAQVASRFAHRIRT